MRRYLYNTYIYLNINVYAYVFVSKNNSNIKEVNQAVLDSLSFFPHFEGMERVMWDVVSLCFIHSAY